MRYLKVLCLSLILLLVASCSSLSTAKVEQVFPFAFIKDLPAPVAQSTVSRRGGECILSAMKFEVGKDSYQFFIGPTGKKFIVHFYPLDADDPTYIWYGLLDEDKKFLVKGRPINPVEDNPAKWDIYLCPLSGLQV